jgi:hypothetical protein
VFFSVFFTVEPLFSVPKVGLTPSSISCKRSPFYKLQTIPFYIVQVLTTKRQAERKQPKLTVLLRLFSRQVVQNRTHAQNMAL